MAQLMPLPLTVSCFSKIQIGFTFLVLAQLGSPGKEPLNGCLFLLLLMFRKAKQNYSYSLHLLLGTLYLQAFVLSTPYSPLNATKKSISSGLLSGGLRYFGP